MTRPRRPFNADPATNTPRPRPATTTLKGATEQLDGHKENAIFRGGHNECVKVYCSQRRKKEEGEKTRKLAGIPKGALHIYDTQGVDLFAWTENYRE